MSQIGIVMAVYRGGCEIVDGDQLRELRLIGRHARDELQLAVGDEVTFDAERGTVVECLPRRTLLQRLRPQGGRRKHDPRRTQAIAANMDRIAIVASVFDPPFRSGMVDRMMLAAAAGGLESILVVNKIDLLQGAALPEEVSAYTGVLPLFEVSAETGSGLEALRAQLSDSRTVFAGHSGVGKSSLLNALKPELRLATGEVGRKRGRGRHTTTHATWLVLGEGAIAVDTPGVRELATGPVDPELLGDVYPDVLQYADACRFRDCRHDREPGCAVRNAIEQGELPQARLAGYQKLLSEL
jgi:ribosome biogenesis GTPase